MPLLNRLAIAAAAIAALSLSLGGVASATSVKSELAGGTHGKSFALECAHEALAGIELRQDDSVHRVQLVCARPTAAGDLDPPHLFDGAAKGDRIGSKKTIMCPENYGIYSLTVVDDGDGVLDVALNCKDVTEGTVTEVDTGWDIDHGGGGAPAGTNLNFLTCDDGSYGVGLHGRVDGSITALGLICSPDIMTAATDTADTGNGSGNGNSDDGGNGGGNGDDAAPPSPPQNTKWAAFAKGVGNSWGFAIRRSTEAQAKSDAVNGCGGGNNSCQVFWTTQESCVAFAMSPAPFFYAAGGGDRQDDAERNAIKFCQSGQAPANSCRVQMAQCQ